jgi:hypothetical protein
VNQRLYCLRIKQAMVIASHRAQKNSQKKRLFRNRVFALLGVVTLVIYVVLATRQQKGIGDSMQQVGDFQSSSVIPNDPAIIETGKTTNEEVAYYHCVAGNQNASSVDNHLVLLHGSAFTKEDWKTSGILDLFCTSKASLSVTALDLSVKASHSDLLAVLDDLQGDGKIDLPISGLVTPSASGYAIIEGIEAGSISELLESIQRWIPVACNGILSVDNEDVFASAEMKSWPILAVYGDKDVLGKHSSEFFQTHSEASVQELSGKHTFYLGAPESFVRTVLAFLKD